MKLTHNYNRQTILTLGTKDEKKSELYRFSAFHKWKKIKVTPASSVVIPLFVVLNFQSDLFVTAKWILTTQAPEWFECNDATFKSAD